MNYTQLYAARVLLAIALFLSLPILGHTQACECSNCPLPIQDNGSFDAFLDVNVDGPDDLGQCPLESVCFTIDHTWIGDLSVSLTSPSGLNYILMADANNSTGGCGTNEDDVDVCISLGSDSPLTNGTEYGCNNGGATPCIVGEWTVACNVTDPMTNADPAPNCTLNDFNISGHPANGTWKLTINDVCAQDVGSLETWSLSFACGVLDCYNCEADGGLLNQPDLVACQFSPELNVGISPSYGSGLPPSATDYGYVYVVTEQSSGNIENLFFNANFVSLNPGVYDICGLSYILSDGAYLSSYIGGAYSTLASDLASVSPPFCGDLSDDCFELEVGSISLATLLEVELCLGDCYTYNTVDYCAPGVYPVNLVSYLGCDSLVNLTIFPLSESNVLIEDILCSGDTYPLGGEEYGPGIHYFNDIGLNGCDSTTTLILSELFVSANIPAAPPITCSVPLVFLNSTGSVGSTYEWTDEDGNVISNQAIAIVSEPGCYSLMVSDSEGGLLCSAVDEICIEEEIIFPSDPSITGPFELCLGDTVSYFSTVDPDYQSFDWTVPSDVDIIGGGDGFPNITVVWNSVEEGDVCLQVANDCGVGNLICESVEFLFALDAPDVSGSTVVCVSDVTAYSAFLPGVDLYNWTLYGVGTIVNDSGTNTIEVAWDEAGPAQLCSSGVSDCGNGPVYCLDIEVGEVPQELELNGPTLVCPEDTLDFFVSNYGSSDSLSWLIPPCFTLINQANTPSDTLSVLWNGTCLSESISVISYNDCGEGITETLLVETIQNPIMNAIVIGDSYCQGETTLINTELVNGVDSYIWSGSNVNIINGQGSNSISVYWPSAGTAQLCLQGEYSCGLSSISCVDLTIHNPAAISYLTGDEEVCLNGIGTYEAMDSLAISYIWTSNCGEIINSSDLSEIDIDWDNCPFGGTVCVQSVGLCDTSAVNCFDVTIQALPILPLIEGPSEFCASEQITFSVEGDGDVVAYNWDIPACGLVLGASNTAEIIIEFDESCPSPVICVSATDECDEGPAICMDLTVNSAPDIGAIQGLETACVGEEQTFSIDPVDGAIFYNWTVVGGDLINGQGTNSIEVEWSTSGVGELCLSVQGDCNEIVPDCKAVEVFPDMALLLIEGADIVCDSSVVDYSVLNIPGALAYVWTSTCGTIVNNSGASVIQIDWTGCPEGGQLCVYAEGNCNDGPLTCIDIDGGSIPLLEGLGGPANSCNGASETYCAEAENASFYNWTVVGGIISGLDNTSCVDVVWSDSASGQLCVQAENGCGLSVTNCFDVNIGQSPQIAQIGGDSSVCEGEIGVYSLENSNLDYDNIEWVLSDQCGDIIGEASDEILEIEWSSSGFCSVCVRLYNSCGESELSCTEVEVKALPAPYAGEDLTVCGLGAHLENAQSGDGTIEWAFLGPGNLTFDVLSETKATIEADAYGQYILFITEEIDACLAVDTVLVSFNELPSLVGDLNFTCDATADNYQVSFTADGGLQPYQLEGLEGLWLDSNTFLTDMIQSGSSYAISLIDDLGCGPVILEGEYTCPCLSDAGSLVQDTVWLCADETFVMDPVQGAFLDGDDTSAYLISSEPLNMGNVQAVVLGQNTGNTIVKESWMFDNTLYYVTHVVADDLLGLPDLNDACLDLSISRAFVFNALPLAAFAQDSLLLCEGDVLELSFNIENASCADILLDMGNGETYSIECIANGEWIEVPLTVNGVQEITITEVSNEYGCSSGSSSSLYVEINDVPDLSIAPLATVCNSEDTGETTTVNLEDYLIEAEGLLIWEDISSCDFSGTLPIIDLEGVAPGDYQFAVRTTEAIAPCADVEAIIILTVEDCNCPNLALSLPSPICNTVDVVNLNEYLLDDTANIEWTLTNSPVNIAYEPVSLEAGIFSMNSAAPGLYTFGLQYTGTAPGACELENELELDLSEQLSSGLLIEEIDLCLGTEGYLDLFELLEGENSSGVWTETSDALSQYGAFDALAGQFSTADQASGVYLFKYTVDADEPCLDQSTVVPVRILELPEVEAGLPGFISCSEPYYDLQPYYDNSYLYSWIWNDILVSENPYYSASEVGLYILETEDSQTGCIAKDSVLVEGFFTNPEMQVDVSDAKCFGESNGLISIVDVIGGEGPYLFSFEGGTYDDQQSYGDLTSGTYTLAIEDIFGCTDSVEVFVGQPALLELDIDFNYDEFESGMLGLGDSIELEAFINIDTDLIDGVQWAPSNLVNCDTCLSVVAYPSQTSILSLSVDVSSCNVRETIQLLVNKEYPYFVPNIVSFNDDGVNDVFYIYGGKEIQQINKMQIYDRWGGLVFSNEYFFPNDPSEGWSGKNLGFNAASGVYAYFFEIEFIDGRVEQVEGSITVRK